MSTDNSASVAVRFVRANLATIVRDDSMEAWKLEVWNDRSLALGLWPLSQFDDLDDASYASVSALLTNVGLVDEGRDGWAKVEDSWMSPLHAVE